MEASLWCQAELPNKRYEQDEEVLKLLLDCLRLLCVRRVLRRELRARMVYPVLRNLDLAISERAELHDRVYQPIRDIVDLIQGEEDPSEARAEAEAEASAAAAAAAPERE